jgi:hypothetical protein
MIRSIALAAALALALSAQPSRAAIVWDFSPDTTHAAVAHPDFSNDGPGQNFLDSVSFASGVSLSGMDIFSDRRFGHVGNPATIKIFSNVGNAPGGLLLKFNETIDAVDQIATSSQLSLTRKHVDFSSAHGLAAGSYWIGMSGASIDDRTQITQGTLSNVEDNSLWLLRGDTPLVNARGVGDMAFRLEGTAIPEPATLALLPVGLALVGLARRRARRAADATA